MRLFRSEEHARRTSEREGLGPGAAVPLTTIAMLARTWYRGRLEEGWEATSTPARQALLHGHGLTGAFWQLPTPTRSTAAG